MKESTFTFNYKIYGSSEELSPADNDLLTQTREFTSTAYAPYSKFQVAAVARLADGSIVKGSNQENASSPVGICAERALLAALGNLYTNIPIEVMAISYNSANDVSAPISPCGMCRQALLEYEIRTGRPFKILLSGQFGEVFELSSAHDLLPLGFTPTHL